MLKARISQNIILYFHIPALRFFFSSPWRPHPLSSKKEKDLLYILLFLHILFVYYIYVLLEYITEFENITFSTNSVI